MRHDHPETWAVGGIPNSQILEATFTKMLDTCAFAFASLYIHLARHVMLWEGIQAMLQQVVDEKELLARSQRDCTALQRRTSLFVGIIMS